MVLLFKILVLVIQQLNELKIFKKFGNDSGNNSRCFVSYIETQKYCKHLLLTARAEGAHLVLTMKLA
jgi:hypothetical protein